MKDSFWAQKKQALAEEIALLERQLEGVQRKLDEVRGKFALAQEWEAEDSNLTVPDYRNHPAENVHPTLSVMIDKAAAEMRKFSKRDLEAYLRHEYPGKRFNLKSLDRPIEVLVEQGTLSLVNKSSGGKPNIYEFVGLL